MNNVCNFRNNVLHYINETKIPSKIIIKSNNRPKETISIFYKANKISNYKVLSENKNNNLVNVYNQNLKEIEGIKMQIKDLIQFQSRDTKDMTIIFYQEKT